MKTANDFLSLEKANKEWIENQIKEREEYIKARLEDLFDDVGTAKILAKEIGEMAELKDARLLMSAPAYKAYAASGKKISYNEFIENVWNQ